MGYAILTIAFIVIGYLVWKDGRSWARQYYAQQDGDRYAYDMDDEDEEDEDDEEY